jgi:hypothetical protein
MPDSVVLDVLRELSLELMTPLRANRMDAKRKLVDDVVDEVHRVGLVVTAVDFESSPLVASSMPRLESAELYARPGP